MTRDRDSHLDASVWTEGAPRRADDERDGPLAGKRLAVKDLFDVAGWRTGAGNADWLADKAPAGADAPVVAALRAAGAAFVGKTQTDELAYSLNGSNAQYGTPTNPAAPTRLAGGSSSGSAVAVARGEAEIGLGTDTGGSIRVPASYTGLYGLRPSHGVIATAGMAPLAPPFDTVGWLCRDLTTLEAVADCLLPPATSTDACTDRDVTLLLPTGSPPDLAARVRAALPSEAAASETLDPAWLAQVSQSFRVLQGRAIWRVLGEWVRRRQPRLGDDVAARFRWCEGLDADDERAAAREREAVIARLERLSDGGARLLAMPTTPGGAPRRDLAGEALSRYREQLMGLTALAGLWRAPQLSLPRLTDEREADRPPWGLSLLGAPGQDRRLLARAR